jgi:hypothetical protein
MILPLLLAEKFKWQIYLHSFIISGPRTIFRTPEWINIFTLNGVQKEKNKENFDIQEFDDVSNDYRLSVQA